MFIRDIHSNKETVTTALYELKVSIELTRKSKNKVLCLIVGYGSSGKTHKINTAVMEELQNMKETKKIKDFIRGNNLDLFCSEYLNFKYKDLIPNEEKKKMNPGAIFVIV